MSSSADNKTCWICSTSLAAGQGQAIFTAECSHSFHFSCISRHVSHVVRHCPVCSAVWNNLPFVPNNNPFDFTNAFRYPLQNPLFQIPQPPFPPPPPVYKPLLFSDDEPLPHTGSDPTSTGSLIGSQKVTIKAIPEVPAVASSQSVSPFAVLVGLKAPSLSNDAVYSQRAAIDIVTVLDVSGSMCGQKLHLLKRAVHFVIENLGVSDRLSIVSFSDRAARILPLRRMTEAGREDAKRAVDSLFARGGTNIVDGLKKGAQVLDERLHRNPVTSIIFLSDGNDTYNNGSRGSGTAPGFLHRLPPSIFPDKQERVEMIPVHSFGFGSDHDPITMHAISDASGGTFSFIESIEMVQDAFASCIGGLLSVLTQGLELKLRSASHGVEIKSIPSGRYMSGILNQGSEGLIRVGELYADEEKEFLINLSLPICMNKEERKTSLLDITCTYKDVVSKQDVVIQGDLVEINRPEVPSPQDLVVNLEVDRQRNRLLAAESIKHAQKMAEEGNLVGATNLLAMKRSSLMTSASAQAGDDMMKWLEDEMKETEARMVNLTMYQQSGRAFALAGMSSHASQRATSRGNIVPGAAAPAGFGGAPAAAMGYGTPQMAKMVAKSRVKKTEMHPVKE